MVEGAGGGLVDDERAGEGEGAVDFFVGFGCREDDDGRRGRLGWGGALFLGGSVWTSRISWFLT